MEDCICLLLSYQILKLHKLNLIPTLKLNESPQSFDISDDICDGVRDCFMITHLTHYMSRDLLIPQSRTINCICEP